CMKAELKPARPEVSRISRSSMPLDTRSSQFATRCRAPVRSRPAPRIMVAMTLMTALPEKPSKIWLAGTRPVSPRITSTTSAVASARMRSNMNMPMVKPTSPSTITMSRVRARPVSMVGAALLGAVVQQVPDAVAELQAAGFEVGLAAPFRARDGAAGAGPVAQAGFGIEHVPHVPGIGLPVGGQVQQAARAQAPAQQVHEGRLEQPPLVVSLLVPGVGEVDAHLIQRAGRDLLAQHLDRVMLVDTQVAQAGGRGGVEQPADAGAMHLDADEIARRLVLAGVQQLLAVAEADLDHARGLAAEHGVEITWLAAVVQAVGGPVQFEGALLGFGLPALAQDEAADRAVPGEVLAGVLVAGVAHVRGRAHRKCPSTGEEAL